MSEVLVQVAPSPGVAPDPASVPVASVSLRHFQSEDLGQNQNIVLALQWCAVMSGS